MPIKTCPINRSCRIELETDAENVYFSRSESPGNYVLCPYPAEHSRLWNGVFSLRVRPPSDAKPGDTIQFDLSITDPDREYRDKSPFEFQFQMLIAPETMERSEPGEPLKPIGPHIDGNREAPGLAVPNIKPIHQSDWKDYTPEFNAQETFRVQVDGSGGYDFILNLDNVYLLNQLRNAKPSDRDLMIYWFKWGVALCAMGILQHARRYGQAHPDLNEDGTDTMKDPVVIANQSMSGIGSVIIPVIRNLNRGPSPV